MSFSFEKQVNMMKNSGKQMLNMVMNILDVQKFEDTKMILETRDHSLFEVAESAVQQVSFLSERKNIVVKNLISVQINRYLIQLRQIKK